MQHEITIISERCKGCNICVGLCPKQVLGLDTLSKVQVLKGEDCIGCGQCELRCPDYAIYVEKKVSK
ncbi:4Fe-4S dicluster domain-containing protein [Azotosporobacter soli]|uniref:4Fe-4S dicluster domain-containing protein n=1 Tax=Azotosporobacter soli TaxID=3055040 RepID=UPI0031FE8D11